VVRRDFQRGADLPHCALGIATLQEDNAEQMQAVEVTGLDRKDAMINLFGIRQLAGLMQRQSFRK
jgi:hypothetical protein